VALVTCPLPTLLFWRFTGGLYYELISDPRFPNEFGEGFQNYVGEVIDRACSGQSMQKIPEQEYSVGKQKKKTVDWIIADEQSALFLECKSKRLSWGAKVSLTDLAPLEADIDSMAAAVVQIYKTLADYQENRYPKFPTKEGRKIYLGVVTPENWRMFGPVMLKKLDEADLPATIAEERPYAILAIEDLETSLQIINSVGIADVMDGKLKDAEMRQWDWHGYLTHCYPKHFPLKRLFDKEYDEITSELHRAQNAKK
jgi:hypothetical protein